MPLSTKHSLMLQCTSSGVNTNIPRCVGENCDWNVVQLYAQAAGTELLNNTRRYLQTISQLHTLLLNVKSHLCTILLACRRRFNKMGWKRSWLQITVCHLYFLRYGCRLRSHHLSLHLHGCCDPPPNELGWAWVAWPRYRALVLCFAFDKLG